MILSATYSDCDLNPRAPILYRGDMAECFKHISQDGFRGVEIHTDNILKFDVSEVKKLLKLHGLKLTSVGTGLLRQRYGLSLTSDDEMCRKEAVKKLKEYIDFAACFDNAVVIIGLLRGKMSEIAEKDYYWKRLSENLIESGKYSEGKHVRLGLEMINRYEADTLNNVEEGMAYLKELGLTGIGIHLDSYHMNIEEADIKKAIKTSSEALIHVHFADNDRYYPGHGHLDFEGIFKALKEISYSGAIAVEAMSQPDSMIAGKGCVDFLKNIKVAEYGT